MRQPFEACLPPAGPAAWHPRDLNGNDPLPKSGFKGLSTEAYAVAPGDPESDGQPWEAGLDPLAARNARH